MYMEGGVPVKIVVAGDAKTGKSNLIAKAASEKFSMPTGLPVDFYMERFRVIIVDTSSSGENKRMLNKYLGEADCVVLTYACDRPETLDRLSSHWLPQLRLLKVKVPVIVVGCKLDKKCDQEQEQVMSSLMQRFPEIDACIECSALNNFQVSEVFYHAQKAVIHPSAPLFDRERKVLQPHFVMALNDIFTLSDHDRDGALNDAELYHFQAKCFNQQLQPSELAEVKSIMKRRLQESVDDRGLTFTGFILLHFLFIERGRPDTAWTVLRKFGYNNHIPLQPQPLPHQLKKKSLRIEVKMDSAIAKT